MSDHVLAVIAFHLGLISFVGLIVVFIWFSYRLKNLDNYTDNIAEWLDEVYNYMSDVDRYVDDVHSYLTKISEASNKQYSILKKRINNLKRKQTSDQGEILPKSELVAKTEELLSQYPEDHVVGTGLKNDTDDPMEERVRVINKHMTGKMDVELNNHDSNTSTVDQVVEELKKEL